MTPEQQKIREAVAAIIRRGAIYPTTSEELADTAIAVVLEEAARVAEMKADEWATKWRKGMKCDSHLEGKSDGADDVAAAIRGLIKKD